ncbi:MAG: type II CAAX endopeptidase family protein [Verrucomicrobiota bacterium]
MPVEESPWALAFALGLFFASLTRGGIWLFHSRAKQERSTAAAYSGFPELSLQRSDYVLFFGVCLLGLVVHPLLFPIFSILVGLWIFKIRDVSVPRLWNLSGREVGDYLATGIDRYLLILIPLMVCAMASVAVFRLLGLEQEPQPLVQEFLKEDNNGQVIRFLILAVVVAPIWEEVMFRGILYPMLKSLQDRTFALISTSLLFGAIHYHGPSFIPLTFLGFVLAWTYERTGKLGYAIALHAVFNCATSIILLLMKYA